MPRSNTTQSTSQLSKELQKLIRHTTTDMNKAFFGPSREAKDRARETLSDVRDIIQDAQEDMSELWTEVNDAMGELEKEQWEPIRKKRKRKQPPKEVTDEGAEAEAQVQSEAETESAGEAEAMEEVIADEGDELADYG